VVKAQSIVVIMEFVLLLAVVTFLYACQVAWFLLGIRRIRDERVEHQPFVSVVIAARNEEENLAACLSSVLRQTYPEQHYEVIVMNDNSTDATEKIASAFAQTHHNLTLRNVLEDTKLRGKANALAQGIDAARGEIILITDADCRVPPTWIEETIRRFSPTVGVMGGMTLQEAHNHFTGMQSLDWAYLLGVAAATAALGLPLSSIGNNFSFRKKAYDDVGGYRNIPFSVTEDYMLFQAIVAKKQWEYRYPLDASLLVMSQPCKTFGDILRQKHRWGTGGLDMKLSGFLIMTIAFSLHVSILVGLALGHVTAVLTSFLIKAVLDYAFLHTVLRRVKRIDLLKYFYSFQLYYLLYVVALPFLVFFGGKVVWKGRTY
jgi:cellulose synthase/poly-beta-1,6-N-acetylglucosamine synthase-like glycosyltransferase